MVGRPLIAAGAALGAAMLWPGAAEAHVKWFVDPAGYPMRADLVFSSRTALALGAVAAALALLYVGQRLVGDGHWPRLPFFERMAIGAPTLLFVHAAIALVFVAVQPAL